MPPPSALASSTASAVPCRAVLSLKRGGINRGAGEGSTKTKSYSPKHRGYKKKGIVDNHRGINHRVILRGVIGGCVCEGDLPPVIEGL